VNRKNVINDDLDVITALVQDYFEGLHHADINKLQRIFHPDAYLKAPGLRRSVAQWLNLVSQREVPAQQGAAFDYRLLSVDIVSEQAMVKLVCPLLGRTYIDFLGLLKENGQWLIVNKMYADL
jgi:putative lumazine-binding protein